MLDLNTRVYSLYWDLTLLCLSRASVEQLTAPKMPPGPGPSNLSRCRRQIADDPFPCSIHCYKRQVSARANTCFQQRFCDIRSLCPCPPRVAQPHPSQRPSGVARPRVPRKPHDARLTFLIADRTLPPSPLPVPPLRRRAGRRVRGGGRAGGPAPDPGSPCADFLCHNGAVNCALRSAKADAVASHDFPATDRPSALPDARVPRSILIERGMSWNDTASTKSSCRVHYNSDSGLSCPLCRFSPSAMRCFFAVLLIFRPTGT